MKKYWYVWLGIAIVLLAVLIVLGVVFLPRWMAESDMEELLSLATAPDPQYVMLIDPAFVNPGVLAQKGKEIRFGDDEKGKIQAELSQIANGFSFEKKEDAVAGAFGLHLLIKTAEGEIVKICVAESSFYAVLDDAACYFVPDDMPAYTEFYHTLIAMLQAQSQTD